jgi:putative glutamine amidotransferase
MVGEKYINAINQHTGCSGVLVPVDQNDDIDQSILNRMDGFLLTGSLSNVHPDQYDKEIINYEMLLDESRDRSVFKMIQSIIQKEMPLLAICRGFQEMNVAFGGSLYQNLELQSDHQGHDFDRDASHEQQYGFSHQVDIIEGSMLHKISGLVNADVNSLHTQGVNDLSDQLEVNALSDHGLVEAFTIKEAKGFNLSVQWHPEWQPSKSELSLTIFNAFGDACRAFAVR